LTDEGRRFYEQVGPHLAGIEEATIEAAGSGSKVRGRLRFGEPPQGSLVARKLIETRVLTVASPAYIKSKGRPQHPKDLEQRDCIDFYER
jgi:DNA-binding transcriptional LysR family regulator